VRQHFLREHVEKGDIEIKYIEIERQLTDIFTKPLNATHFASLCGGRGGDLVFAIPIEWFEGELVILYILYLIYIALHYIHIYLIYLFLHLLC
jgi:hypothetical protein